MFACRKTTLVADPLKRKWCHHSEMVAQIHCLDLPLCQIAIIAKSIGVHLLAILTGVNAWHSKQISMLSI